MKVCCPCDELKHPAKPDIPAGLSALPRQLAGFPEYRLAMLRDIPTYAPLAQWRAREEDDLGLMLLEMWAYTLDILGFYDERIANESYLRTAVLRPSLRKLVGLIGYQARPALAASVVLAAIADGNRPVVLPPRTGFRSDAFGSEPPQVFETEVEHVIHPLKNEWTLGPVRESTVSDRLLLQPDTARLTRDQIAVFVWPASQQRTGSNPSIAFQRVSATARIPKSIVLPFGESVSVNAAAGKVIAAKAVAARDGQTYIELAVEPPPQFAPEVRLADVQILSPSLSATVTALPVADPSVASILPLSTLQLDAVYKQIQQDDIIVISRRSEFRPFKVVSARETDPEVDKQVQLPVTELEVSPALPDTWQAALRSLTVHFQMGDGGKLTRVAKTQLNATDFTPPGVPTEGLVEPIPESVAKPSELLLLDAMDNGVLAGGTITVSEDGEGATQLAPLPPPFEPALRTPVTVFGNLVRATRGESVVNEVLGSGDASQTFQSFTLGNKPLTYLNDPSVPNGRRSTLEVRVNGIKWKEVPSFFGAGPQDEVYIVRQNDEQETIVTFGDGKTGARLPTGVDNITATYRFGGGAAKPPAGAIGQLARPVEGLRRVVNPVEASGGADSDRPEGFRKNAPNSALILGRAVSVPDFEALTREFGGVVNANVEWAWDETCQGAVVKVWFISDGGDIAKALRTFLIGQADLNTPLVAEEAQAQPSELIIELEIDPRFNTQIVIEQVKQALTSPDTGILALENIPIGRPLFRSRIFDAVLSVEGTHSVRAMTVDGRPAPFAITVAQGGYRDFLDGLVIGSTQAP